MMDHLVTRNGQHEDIPDGQSQHFNVNAIVAQYEHQTSEGITNTVIDISDDDSSVSIYQIYPH